MRRARGCERKRQAFGGTRARRGWEREPKKKKKKKKKKKLRRKEGERLMLLMLLLRSTKHRREAWNENRCAQAQTADERWRTCPNQTATRRTW